MNPPRIPLRVRRSSSARRIIYFRNRLSLSNVNPTMADFIYSVRDLTEAIKERIETEFPDVWLRGEISNFKRATSGHVYFTLKDKDAQIGAVIWNSLAERLSLQLADGLEVIARGRVEVYAPHGKYQLIVAHVKPVGEGDLQKAFNRLLEKLKREGLFDEAHKKPLPRLPERIGVVTSPTGAVIQDICSILARRYPVGQVVLFPARVQGEGAPEEIVAGLRYFNGATNPNHQVDVIIVARGGGSLEDLWAFNDERVARAVFESRIPVVSAVGHQTDFTICDFVADARAATPSNAAELVAPSASQILAGVADALELMRRETLKRLDERRSRVREIAGSYAFNKPLRDLRERAQTLDRLSERLALAMKRKLERAETRLANLERRLVALGYEQTLRRGFALAFKNGKLIRSASELGAGDDVVIRFADGEIVARVGPKP